MCIRDSSVVEEAHEQNSMPGMDVFAREIPQMEPIELESKVIEEFSPQLDEEEEKFYQSLELLSQKKRKAPFRDEDDELEFLYQSRANSNPNPITPIECQGN
eukprot:TRINITY_DN1064_c0_g1_i1.p1 TRINITY_DN1064_c0_g1~~TRINITY_DN1064_c0_g1_i1.p1  ORF type:complete len:102 (+),score=27.78 TRINITY_DN1064_c0_g1_i1:52-357(+)